ncbi:hypothetical protein SMICM17S_07969 [Streptomyces microflavus]
MPNPFRLYGALSADATIPAPALICLIGPAGSGKSTLARRWAETQVLELDRFRAMVSDDFSVKLSVLNFGHALQVLPQRPYQSRSACRVVWRSVVRGWLWGSLARAAAMPQVLVAAEKIRPLPMAAESQRAGR